MEKIIITIETGNDAFQPYPMHELIKIFEKLKMKSIEGSLPSKILDSNGNTVGKIEIE